MLRAETLDALKARFGELATSEFRGQVRVVVPLGQLHDVLAALKEEHGFDFLVDVTCVDYLNYRGATDRFGMVYSLLNTETSERIIIRAFLNDPEPTVPTVYDLWKGADWLEREVWDLFGIRFEGHPDLRRVVLPEGFEAHPLRKDYPLQGRGERHNLPVITRAER
jgi:NADH-quinone oxidoreductase subunit C